MAERIIRQALEAIDDENVMKAMSLINDHSETTEQAEEIKEETARLAVSEGYASGLTIGNIIRNNRLQRAEEARKRKIPRHEDDDINRDIIREAIARQFQRKRRH